MDEVTQKTKRRKGEGSITQMAEGRWRVLLEIGKDANGKRQRKTLVVYSEKDAVKALNGFKKEQAKGQLVSTNNIKVSDFATRWLKMKESTTKKTTYRSYVQTIEKYINPFMGTLKLQKVTTAKVNDFIAGEYERGLSTGSVARHKAVLHGILELAVSEGIIPINVSDKCEAIKIEHKETRALTPEESEQLLRVARAEYTRDKGKGNRFWQMYHIILLAMSTGMRRGEIAGLRVANIDFVNNEIKIVETIVEIKGGISIDTPKSKKSNRTISVDAVVMERLKELLEADENAQEETKGTEVTGQEDAEKEQAIVKDSYLFHTRDGKPLTPSNINRAFRKTLKKAGIGHVRFHDLRHTHTTFLINNGVDVKTVSARIGHEDVRLTLNQYTHVVTASDKRAATLMSSLLNIGDHDITKD